MRKMPAKIIETDRRLVDYLFRLEKFGKINAYDRHQEYGKISGIRQCCIDNFINLMKKGIPPARYMDLKFKNPPHTDIEYVLCEKCLEEYWGTSNIRINEHKSEIELIIESQTMIQIHFIQNGKEITLITGYE